MSKFAAKCWSKMTGSFEARLDAQQVPYPDWLKTLCSILGISNCMQFEAKNQRALRSHYKNEVTPQECARFFNKEDADGGDNDYSKFKVGQLVTTPDGKGKILKIDKSGNGIRVQMIENGVLMVDKYWYQPWELRA